MTTLRTNYQEGEILHASDMNSTNAEVNAKSTVSVSSSGTATDEVSYITVNGVEKKIAGGGSGESVFIAEYNTTTWAQLEEAINSGKLIFCKYEAEEEDPVYASLYSVNVESKEAIFSAVWMMPIDVGMEDDVTQYCGTFIMVSVDEGQTSWLSAPSFGAIPIATSQLTNDSNFASLPTTVNDRYLHTNSSTGALEWATVTGGSGVFVATYGTTTWNDIYTHLGNGEMVIVAKDNKVYSYVSSTSSSFVFCNIIQASSSEIYVSSVYVTSSNTWATINEVQIPILPTVVNDRYLHTNASTGALEWSEVQGGGGEPNAYLKNASVSGNTLTLTKKDDSTVTFIPSGALPTGTAPSNALIYDGTNWTQQSGYGYKHNDAFYSGTFNLEKLYEEEEIYGNSFSMSEEYLLDVNSLYIITINNIEYRCVPVFSTLDWADESVYIGAVPSSSSAFYPDFSFCPILISSYRFGNDHKWYIISQNASVTVTIKKENNKQIEQTYISDTPTLNGTFYKRNVTSEQTDYSDIYQCYHLDANYDYYHIRLLYNKPYIFKYNNTDYVLPWRYTRVEIREEDEGVWTHTRTEYVLYLGEIEILYVDDTVPEEEKQMKGWKPKFTTYPICATINGYILYTDDETGGISYSFGDDNYWTELFTSESSYTLSIAGEYQAYNPKEPSVYCATVGQTTAIEMLYAITFYKQIYTNNYMFKLRGSKYSSLLFEQFIYGENEDQDYIYIQRWFLDPSIEKITLYDYYGWWLNDGVEMPQLPRHEYGETGKKLVLQDGEVKWVPDSGGGGATAWGSITGTLSSQTDLQTALNAKQNSLPTVVNDKYLHTNASTGALEWSTVSGGNSVFIAEYNTTSYQDITSAINANKVVLCKYSQNGSSIYAPTGNNVRYARLCDVNNSTYQFSTTITVRSEDGREVYLISNTIQVSLNGTQTQWEGDIASRIIPRMTSQLTNDSNFITSSYHDSTKQNTLVSGNNIKTINNQSILGSGNINISGGTSNVMIAIFEETSVSDIQTAYYTDKTIIVKDYLYDSEEMWTDNYGRMAYLSDVEYYEEEEEIEEGEYETIQCLRFYFTQVSGREGKTYVYTIDTYEDYWYREQM